MAALYAKQAGHSVEIWEAGGHIGGNALCACKPFFKRDMHRMIRYFERELLVHDIPRALLHHGDAGARRGLCA